MLVHVTALPSGTNDENRSTASKRLRGDSIYFLRVCIRSVGKQEGKVNKREATLPSSARELLSGYR
jgi:hypothetical protein